MRLPITADDSLQYEQSCHIGLFVAIVYVLSLATVSY